MNLIEYADRDMMAIDLANRLAGELTAVLQHQDRATLVVPGGTTPGAIFDNLCDVDLDWDRIDVVLSDERWLPQNHPRSNTRLIKKRLLTGQAAAARLIPLYAPMQHPEDAIPVLEAELSSCLPISVALLGMGGDMHTASLFPRGDNLRLALDPHAPLLVPMRAEGLDEQRITLSARVLRNALNLHIVITGEDKKEAVMRAEHLSPEEAPVKAVLDTATIHWAK
ncbi:6-phosphogluconolactonase [Thalassovita gelatinovora]|uniref:6-phosphogluconolactonase n=1 Tax=Thalassovita gelatinovora TaxID=53501 RepID=A0A0P1FTR0_THAGE|nr:6-phosphogluconolactonase [Thalassovita gelatinovora]QIZ79389.1 6-phosphogluconolactonase [Thalassovita gelatinovora]CUH62709.1 6-phosphogluconolactonase [Thalassovita gelatinovora]SEQ08864.1 6-phosphogluconolactonase [Thalassovita gelatinovora]